MSEKIKKAKEQMLKEYLSSQLIYVEYTSYIEKMILFNKKAEKFCTHNEKYINDISEVDSPNYKKDIKPIKRGQVFYTKK